MVVLYYLFSFLGSLNLLADASPRNFSILQFVSKNGYPIESHQVLTEDGYILTLHRIPYGRKPPKNDSNKFPKRRVVFLMHGLFLSSDCYVLGGRNGSLAFLLADQGYDVWMGNARGNVYSKKHVKLDSGKDGEFWDFSWHEIGYYDLPASIVYVLTVSKSNQLFYVGYSQGGSSFFVMASERPEMNKFVRAMVGIAPAVFVANQNLERNIANTTISALFLRTVEKIRNQLPLYEVGPDSKGIAHYLMLSVRSLIELAHVDLSKLKEFQNVLPSSVSSRQLFHYAQVLLSGKFRKYDFGRKLNQIKYGRKQPPFYNLTKVTTPVALYFGSGDFLVTPQNGRKLEKALPNVISAKTVPSPGFNHFDFVIGKNAINVLYKDILALLARF